MGDDHHQHHGHGLRIQTDNLLGLEPLTQTPIRIPSNNSTLTTATTSTTTTTNHSNNSMIQQQHTPLLRSFTNDSTVSTIYSPLLTPSGSQIHIPSSTITPLPSPLDPNFSTSFETLVPGANSPRRKPYYGLLGPGLNLPGERRIVSESSPSPQKDYTGERSVSVSSIATSVEDGLRREHSLLYDGVKRSRENSFGAEFVVLSFLNLG
jgi:hypothetical protein